LLEVLFFPSGAIVIALGVRDIRMRDRATVSAFAAWMRPSVVSGFFIALTGVLGALVLTAT